MANPLSGLRPALEVLAHNMDILPATGQAIEDLAHPDQEEVEDEILNADALRPDTLIETPSREIYRATPPLPRTERHFFRYFLDGSRRSHFIGTALEHERSTPIQLAQIGAAIIRRLDDGSVRTEKCDRRLLLLVAKDQISDAAWQQLKAQESEALRVENIGDEDELTGPPRDREDLRNRASAKASWFMHRLEVDYANALAPGDEDDWLIIDGSINFTLPITRANTIGVAKSFSKRPVFTIGRGPRAKRIPLYNLLAELPTAYRTCAFAGSGGQLGFWYLRLREQGEVEYPLMGVIKVEIRNPGGEALPTEKIDLISRALVAERHVTCYGCDRRWHVHLYPVYLAEQLVKNGFVSQEIIRGAIRWPTSTQMNTRR
jgi:hypothetical protein